MKRNQQGFTLIEMLIVLLIIGVLLGMTLLTPITGSIHKVIEDQASRLQMLFQGIRDKALVENTQFGFSIDNSGKYTWWMLPFGNKKWVEFTKTPFNTFSMPKGYEVRLDTGALSHQEIDHNDKQVMPSIAFYTDGGSTPFNLSIIPVSDKKETLRLQTDGVSDVHIFQE